MDSLDSEHEERKNDTSPEVTLTLGNLHYNMKSNVISSYIFTILFRTFSSRLSLL